VKLCRSSSSLDIAGIRNGDIRAPWLKEALRNVGILVEGDNL